MERAAMLSLPRCPMKERSREWQIVPVNEEPSSRKVKISWRLLSAERPHTSACLPRTCSGLSNARESASRRMSECSRLPLPEFARKSARTLSTRCLSVRPRPDLSWP